MVYFWGTKASSISFNSCSQLLIFNLPCRLLRCFRCCHHKAITPRNVSITKETRRSSGTPLNSKNSSTANIQYQNFEGCNTPGNSGILSLNPSTYRVAWACAWCWCLCVLRFAKGFLDPFPLWQHKLDIWVGEVSSWPSNARNWSSLYCWVSAINLPSASARHSLGWRRQPFGPPLMCRKRIVGYSLHAVSLCVYTTFMSVKRLLLLIHGM